MTATYPSWCGATARVRTQLAACAFLVAATLLTSELATGQDSPCGQAEAPQPAAYLLVIDHSRSMIVEVEPGITRWQSMQQRAIELVNAAPLGTYFWIAVFEGEVRTVRPYNRTIDRESDREWLVGKLKAERDPEGRTALYDTMALAFEHAIGLSARDRNRLVTVYVFSDDDDSKEGKLKTREAVEEKFTELKLVNPAATKWEYRLDSREPAVAFVPSGREKKKGPQPPCFQAVAGLVSRVSERGGFSESCLWLPRPVADVP